MVRGKPVALRIWWQLTPKVWTSPVQRDPTCTCEVLVDLTDVNILGVESRDREVVTLQFECRRVVVGCPECGGLPG